MVLLLYEEEKNELIKFNFNENMSLNPKKEFTRHKFNIPEYISTYRLKQSYVVNNWNPIVDKYIFATKIDYVCYIYKDFSAYFCSISKYLFQISKTIKLDKIYRLKKKSDWKFKVNFELLQYVNDLITNFYGIRNLLLFFL